MLANNCRWYLHRLGTSNHNGFRRSRGAGISRVGIFLLLLGCIGHAQDSQWTLRSRVCCDNVAGYTFRFPNQYFIRDQYKVELMHEFEYETEVVTVNGKRVRVELPPPTSAEIRGFSVLAKDLPAQLQNASFDRIGNVLTEQKLSWSPFDYYRKAAERPQAAVIWAPKGIEAELGESADYCALVCKHEDRYSGIVMVGRIGQFENRSMIDSFEVMNGGKNGKPFINWRESQCRTGKVFTAAGKVVAASEGAPVPWNSGWDMETAHFHITTQVSRARLQQYGGYLEALYRAYSKIYQPEGTPSFKMEVNIFNTQKDFMEASAAHDSPMPSTVGGFFTPDLLSIFAYQQCNLEGDPAFTVEKVLAHECSHQFLHVTCNGSDNVPTWINEGLAVYFESGIFSDGQFIIRPPTDRIQILKDLYSQMHHTLRPLESYLNYHGSISPEEYGEVYAMVDYWLFGTCHPSPELCSHKNCGVSHFRAYWKALKRHEDGGKAFEEIFMKDLVAAKHGNRQEALDDWQLGLLDFVKHLQ